MWTESMDWVDQNTKTIGRLLAESKRVKVLRRRKSQVDAVVRDLRGTPHEVWLDFEKGKLNGSDCSCDRSAPAGLCEHVYATLLELERLDEEKTAKPKVRQWETALDSVAREICNAGPGDEEAAEKPASRQHLFIIDIHSAPRNTEGLALLVATRDRKANGEWGATKARRFDSIKIEDAQDAGEQRTLAMLRGILANSYGYYYDYGSSYDYCGSRMTLRRDHYQSVLPLLCGSGRCYTTQKANVIEGLDGPLAWDDGPAWELWLRVRPDEKGAKYIVSGALRRGEVERDLSDPKLMLPGGILFMDNVVARLNHHGAWGWVQVLRRQGAIIVPAAESEALLAKLVSMPALPKLELPEEMKVQEVTGAPAGVMRVRAPKPSEYPASQLVAHLSFDYEGVLVPRADARRAVFHAERRRLLRRDAMAEHRLQEQLQTLKFKPERNGYGRSSGDYRLASGHLPKAVRELMLSGWRVEADGKLYRQPGKFDVQVTSGIDWFDLTAKVDFDGVSVGLPKLLAAVKKGDGMVVLDDGSMGMLPEDWLKKYAFIAGAGEADGESIRFRKSQAGLLDAMLASQPEARWDEAFDRTRRELRSFDGIKPVDPPPTFQGELRPYQRDAQGWFGFLQRFGFGGCLADDMGLGKTVQVLALLEARRQDKDRKPSIVVVPRSLVFNWQQEAKRFAPQLRVLDQTGNERVKATDHLTDYDLIVTTYGTLRRDVTYLKDAEFDYVILDEAQAVKNPASESAKAVRLVKGRHRLALSGTPVQNHLGDLWSLFDFLNPGMLGTASVFAMTGAASKIVEAETKQMLSKALRPFILRRTKEQVAKDLPAKLEQTIYCEMEGEQRKLYNELREHYRQSLLKTIETQGIAKSKIQILEALLRLRQAALHPGLIDKTRVEEDSAKLDMLMPRLTEIIDEGHKALVFSQFTQMLAIVRRKLDEKKIVYEYLDGKTRDREERVRRFQSDDKCKLFLISLKAGGLGLNLTAADYVFLLDPWWNPAVEQQAIDRAHRIGQSKQVYACRLIAKDTVEEKVLALQQSKRDLADAIITADNSVLRTIGREDLELLLS